ncbi:MAG: 3',5'-cyclic-nucleotide phosphodiesterase [Deltaproteobacteria bacterium]|nr:3',5'-cyclic-nucleotide phosphodiesterase [Deltaproteobacteria bacterium]
MQVKVLGSSGSEVPGHNSPAFLIEDFLLLDAGTVSLCLNTEAQWNISHIFITHAHLDHIKAIPFLVDNMVSSAKPSQVTIFSGRDVIADLKRNIFNNRIWPDFTVIPDAQNPVMRYQEISTRGCLDIRGFKIRASRVNHSVPAYGYIVENALSHCLVYTGDTGPTERIWKRMKGRRIKGLIVEVSFPDEMRDLALASGHLTPALLRDEIRKMPVLPETIYITHLKPHYKVTIQDQLDRIPGVSIELLQDGMVLTI